MGWTKDERSRLLGEESRINICSLFCHGDVVPSFCLYFPGTSRRWSWCACTRAGWFWTVEQGVASSWCGQSCIQDPLCSPTTRVHWRKHGWHEETGSVYSMYAKQASLPVWNREVWGVWLGQRLVRDARRTVCGERFHNQKWPRTSVRRRNGPYAEVYTRDIICSLTIFTRSLRLPVHLVTLAHCWLGLCVPTLTDCRRCQGSSPLVTSSTSGRTTFFAWRFARRSPNESQCWCCRPAKQRASWTWGRQQESWSWSLCALPPTTATSVVSTWVTARSTM